MASLDQGSVQGEIEPGMRLNLFVFHPGHRLQAAAPISNGRYPTYDGSAVKLQGILDQDVPFRIVKDSSELLNALGNTQGMMTQSHVAHITTTKVF